MPPARPGSRLPFPALVSLLPAGGREEVPSALRRARLGARWAQTRNQIPRFLPCSKSYDRYIRNLLSPFYHTYVKSDPAVACGRSKRGPAPSRLFLSAEFHGAGLGLGLGRRRANGNKSQTHCCAPPPQKESMRFLGAAHLVGRMWCWLLLQAVVLSLENARHYSCYVGVD